MTAKIQRNSAYRCPLLASMAPAHTWFTYISSGRHTHTQMNLKKQTSHESHDNQWLFGRAWSNSGADRLRILETHTKCVTLSVLE